MNWFWHKITLITQFLIAVFSGLTVMLLGQFKVKGLDHVKGLKSGLVFAGHHQSEMDVVLMPTALFFTRHMPMFFVTMGGGSDDYKRFGWRGRLLYRGNGLFFKILGGRPALRGRNLNYDKKLASHIKLLEKGRNVCIFPGGEISQDGKVGKGRPGVAHLMHRVKCPVVPFTIHGMKDLSVKNLILGRVKITVEFGKPIMPANLISSEIEVSMRRNDYKLIAEQIMDRIRSMTNIKKDTATFGRQENDDVLTAEGTYV